VDTLKNSFHVRIEYPWQKEERAAKQAAAGADAAASAAGGGVPVPTAAPDEAKPEPGSITQRILIEDRLHSADEPRPRTVAGKEIAGKKESAGKDVAKG